MHASTASTGRRKCSEKPACRAYSCVGISHSPTPYAPNLHEGKHPASAEVQLSASAAHLQLRERLGQPYILNLK